MFYWLTGSRIISLISWKLISFFQWEHAFLSFDLDLSSGRCYICSVLDLQKEPTKLNIIIGMSKASIRNNPCVTKCNNLCSLFAYS